MIEDSIAEAINYFHWDAALTFGLQVDLDVQITLIAGSLYYDEQEQRPGVWEMQAKTLFCKILGLP